MIGLSILVVTFKRDPLLFRCVDSIREFYPDIPIFVADSGEKTDNKEALLMDRDCIYYELPPGCGFSGAKNIAFERMPKKTRYVMLVEDDLVFTKKTRLESMFEIMESNRNIAILCCRREGERESEWAANLKIEDKNIVVDFIPKFEWKKTGEHDRRYMYCDYAPNTGIFRRSVVERVLWDGEFNFWGEHLHNFMRFKMSGKCKVAYTDECSVIHDHVWIDDYDNEKVPDGTERTLKYFEVCGIVMNGWRDYGGTI